MSKRISSRVLERAKELIRSSKGIAIGTHIRPDGDALASLLGLARALEQNGLRVSRLCDDKAPTAYQFLPESDQISSEPPEWSPDLGIVVDCDGLSRVGHLQGLFAGLPHVIDIDHHGMENAFGDVHLIDGEAGAAAEIVYDLIRSLGAKIDGDTATCLYTGILTDTGRFSYANTTATSLEIASSLVRAGAEPQRIAREVYEERSLAATHLLGVALSRVSFDGDGKVVSAALMLQDFAETGAASVDTEGIIDNIRAISGPFVALLFVEVENRAVRVSFRSDDTIDVSEIALEFGGGGHAMAAGCTVTGGLAEVQERVLGAVRRNLAGSNPSDVA